MGPLTPGSVKAFHILLDQPFLKCYANLFMAKEIDPKTIELANSIEWESNPIGMLKRFLDDIFMAYTGSVKFLHTLLDQLNIVHPTIKHTMSPTNHSNTKTPEFDCEPTQSLEFLDTLCDIENGKIITDLNRKEMD